MSNFAQLHSELQTSSFSVNRLDWNNVSTNSALSATTGRSGQPLDLSTTEGLEQLWRENREHVSRTDLISQTQSIGDNFGYLQPPRRKRRPFLDTFGEWYQRLRIAWHQDRQNVMFYLYVIGNIALGITSTLIFGVGFSMPSWVNTNMDYAIFVPLNDTYIRANTYQPAGAPDTWRTPSHSFFDGYPTMDNSSMVYLVMPDGTNLSHPLADHSHITAISESDFKQIEEPMAQLLLADRFGLWSVCMTVSGVDSCGLMGTGCDMTLCSTQEVDTIQTQSCWDQEVSLIFSCSMYEGVRTLMTMQVVVYLLPWIGFTVCLVMNYRPYAAAVVATIIQILGVSLLGLGLSLFYLAVFSPLQRGVAAVTSIEISLGSAFWITLVALATALLQILYFIVYIAFKPVPPARRHKYVGGEGIEQARRPSVASLDAAAFVDSKT